jgi:hypothetical protein
MIIDKRIARYHVESWIPKREPSDSDYSCERNLGSFVNATAIAETHRVNGRAAIIVQVCHGIETILS